MPLQKIFIILSVVFFTGTFVSCEIINPEEQIPAYIHIDSIGLNNQNNPEYGSDSHKITDAWIYIDDQVVGAFELPAKFPVLWKGNHTITIKAGIKVNGMSETRAIYPFYEAYSTTIDFTEGNITTLNPVLTYSSSTEFEWEESFEDGGLSLEETSISNAILEKTDSVPEVFEGNFSGIAHLDNAHNFFQCKTINSYELPSGSNPVFLEMNYKTDEEVKIGLLAKSATQTEQLDILVLNKTDVWKKVYVNLKNAILRTAISPDNFQIFFEAQKTEGVASSGILFDNIKLLHN